eukprot:CAMPEP_0179463700 /NCGR_PEP_ID=MMETSP0799-20121207/45687_1 /TAXON_ID=46947 /ORGANISM="Geminigera cryophila, Strain CCMP2564" /LENGTH=95 /DNA_ID=CAMNT_0021267087 /DNA_START=19 /DNA_END=302 /DNA_ORIENTATION=+
MSSSSLVFLRCSLFLGDCAENGISLSTTPASSVTPRSLSCWRSVILADDGASSSSPSPVPPTTTKTRLRRDGDVTGVTTGDFAATSSLPLGLLLP